MTFLTFFVTSIAMLVLFATIYIKVTPYNELKALREGKLVPVLPLLGGLIGVGSCLVAAQVISTSLVTFVMVGAVGIAAQLVVYFVVEKFIFHKVPNCGENVAANSLLFTVSLVVAGLNIVSLIPYA